jgi:hypothetical protein
MMLSQLSLSLDDHLERQIPALNHRAGMADVAGRNLLERANSRLESEFPDPKQTWDRMEENEDGQSTAEYDLAINGYINLCPPNRVGEEQTCAVGLWRGSGLLSSRTKLRTGHSKDAVRAGPLNAFSENGEARGEGSEHAPCRHTLGPRGCHQRSCHGFFCAVLLVR